MEFWDFRPAEVVSFLGLEGLFGACRRAAAVGPLDPTPSKMTTEGRLHIYVHKHTFSRAAQRGQ